MNIKDVRVCLANLIIYGQEIGDDVPNQLLINTLYLLRNFEEKFKDKDDNFNINIEEINREIDEKTIITINNEKNEE